MARFTIQTSGVVLDESLIPVIRQILGPYSLPPLLNSYQKMKRSQAADEGENRRLYEHHIAEIERAIEDGGTISWLGGTATDVEGVTRTWDSGKFEERYLQSFSQGRFGVIAGTPYGTDSNTGQGVYRVTFDGGESYLRIDVDAPDEEVKELASRIDAALAPFRVEPPPAEPPTPFVVFIAYGGGRAWEVVRDYLKRAEVEVHAFTEAERASRVTIDVVSEMINASSLAIIVMTRTDEQPDGTWRARQNVVHEAGFAQGALGIRNTIILLEAGVELPSNLNGVTYIEFRQGEIHTTEDRIVAIAKSARADRAAITGH